MAKEFFKDLPDTSTPLTAARINGLLNGEESMGNISVENVASRNLFNLNTISIGGLDENGTIVDSSSVTINNLDISQGIINFTANAWRGIISDFIRVDSGSALILNGTFSADNYFYRVVSYNANKEFISFFDDFYTMPHNISIPDGVSYIKILLGRGAEAGSISFNGLQLEEGLTATSYVPYLNLQELQENKIITESGSNNYGYYTKFADGTMICQGTKLIKDINATTQWGPLYSGTISDPITFPVTFITYPTTNVTVGNESWPCMISSTTTLPNKISQITIVRNVSSTGMQVRFNYITIGRWK